MNLKSTLVDWKDIKFTWESNFILVFLIGFTFKVTYGGVDIFTEEKKQGIKRHVFGDLET